MFPFADPVVRVGLNPTIETKPEWDQKPIAQQHGIVDVVKYDGGEKLSFGLVVDKPRHLKRPHEDLIKDMFTQVQQMGYHPLALDIRVNGQRRVYEPGKTSPVLEQRLT